MLFPTNSRTTLLPKVFLALVALFLLIQCSQIKLFLPLHSSSDVVIPVDGDYIDPWFQDAQRHNAPVAPTTTSTPAPGKLIIPPPQQPQKQNDSDDDDDDDEVEDLPPPSRPADYNQTFVRYGQNQCLPLFDEELKNIASERNKSCAEYAPFIAHETRRVGFASITTGEKKEAYQRAIESQMFHAAVHGSSIHVLCDQLADSTFNKIAFLLNLVMNEMLKPASERLEWIMWVDRDAIVIDQCRPLSSFLPPNTREYRDVNLIVNNDGGGLNNGVFLFKVNRWSLELFNTILAYRYYRPDADLTFAEQSAQEAIMYSDKFKRGTVRVPWHWFNAFPDEELSVEKFAEGLEPDDLEWFRARKGDFMVHFAGDVGRAQRMVEWENMLRSLGNVWEDLGAKKRDVTAEVKRFWKSWERGTLTEKQISGEPRVRTKEHVETRE